VPSSVQSNLQCIDFMSMLRVYVAFLACLRVYVAFVGVFSRLGSPATFGRVLRTWWTSGTEQRSSPKAIVFIPTTLYFLYVLYKATLGAFRFRNLGVLRS